MANNKIQWISLFVTFIISCISFTLYIISICTPYWISAMAFYRGLDSDEAINYGLFSGTAIRRVLASRFNYDLTVVCNYTVHACAYSCQNNPDNRESELQKILNNEQLPICPAAPRSVITRGPFNLAARQEHLSEDFSKQYLPAEYWISTIVFLSLAIAFTAASGAFSLINMSYRPVEPIFNIFGLYIWNGIAAGASLLALILWGILFGQHLTDNVAVSDTLNSDVPFISKGNASFGFSYYIMIIAFVLNLINIGVLVLRAYFIKRNAEPPTITIDNDDSPLEFY